MFATLIIMIIRVYHNASVRSEGQKNGSKQEMLGADGYH